MPNIQRPCTWHLHLLDEKHSLPASTNLLTAVSNIAFSCSLRERILASQRLPCMCWWRLHHQVTQLAQGILSNTVHPVLPCATTLRDLEKMDPCARTINVACASDWLAQNVTEDRSARPWLCESSIGMTIIRLRILNCESSIGILKQRIKLSGRGQVDCWRDLLGEAATPADPTRNFHMTQGGCASPPLICKFLDSSGSSSAAGWLRY